MHTARCECGRFVAAGDYLCSVCRRKRMDFLSEATARPGVVTSRWDASVILRLKIEALRVRLLAYQIIKHPGALIQAQGNILPAMARELMKGER